MKRSNQGFTLLEIMIVMVIVGLLASIAFPHYDEYLKRSKRTEGQTFLIEVASRQERYFSQNNQYVVTQHDLGKLYSSQNPQPQSATGLYRLDLELGSSDDAGYVLIAVPQFVDSKCAHLTLNGLNALGYTGSAKTVNECWR